MSIGLFNTLARKIEPFTPANELKVNLYTCGPTVYNYVHIGNLRAYIAADILKRALELNGYDIDWVMNVTDVDDKTIANTIKEFGNGAGPEELNKFTDKYFQAFLEDLKKIGINPESISFVKVTEKIADIQLYILELIKKGYAYKADDGSTYFSINKYQEDFGDYGALVGEKFLEGKKIGARVKVDEYEKENLSDFALWKAHGQDDGQIFWDNPQLGRGRPGWHIECTLINYLKFPSGTDIHTGGVDLIFPHHTNEIAQAQPIYKPFVNYWMHSEHLLVDGKKMAKSLKNFFILTDLEKAHSFSGLDLRFLYLQTHYRTKINVTKESLLAAQTGLKNLRKTIAKLRNQNTGSGNLNSGDIQENYSAYVQEFKDRINDDLNTAQALALLQRVITSDMSVSQKLKFIEKADEIFGLDLLSEALAEEKTEVPIPENIKDLIKERDIARADKDFTRADALRKDIETLGFDVLDTPQGTQVKLGTGEKAH